MKIHLYPQSWRLSLSKHSHNLLRSRKNNSPFFKTSICLSWSALLSSSRHSAISPSIEPYSWVCTMILKSSSTFRSGDEKFSVSRRRDHNSLLSSLCRWCIKAIAQKEFGGYRISYAQQKTTHDVVIGVITRLLFYLVSHHVALEF